MLRRARNELPQYAVFDDEFLAQQFFTGEPGYGSLPAEKELAIRQDDWRAGLGLEIYDATDPKRYHKSTMDMRFRSMGIAGWKSNAITAPTPVLASPLFDNMEKGVPCIDCLSASPCKTPSPHIGSVLRGGGISSPICPRPVRVTLHIHIVK